MIPIIESAETMLPRFLAGVGIKTASVPPVLNGAIERGVLWQAAPGRFMLDVPEVARYLVEDGSLITIEPMPQTNIDEVGRYFRMTPLAALLFQRGVMAFHAAAAATRQGAILLAGDSGAGKSTLLAALMKRGWTILSDDLAMVDLDEQGNPVVFPVCQDILLWPDATEKKEIAVPPSRSPFNDTGRRVISLTNRFTSAPQPLRAVYWLSVHNKDEIEIKEVEGTERFGAWGTFSYNSHIADALFDRAVYFRKAVALSGAAPLRRLRRPRGRWSVEELADRVAGEWQ